MRESTLHLSGEGLEEVQQTGSTERGWGKAFHCDVWEKRRKEEDSLEQVQVDMDKWTKQQVDREIDGDVDRLTEKGERLIAGRGDR